MPNTNAAAVITTLTFEELRELPDWLDDLIASVSIKSSNAARIQAVIQKLRLSATPGGQQAARYDWRDRAERDEADAVLVRARVAQLADLAATIASGVAAARPEISLIDREGGTEESIASNRERIANASLEIARLIIAGAEK